MRSDKVKEEYKHTDQVIGRIKGIESLLRLVPSLELMMEGFYEVVRYVILE